VLALEALLAADPEPDEAAVREAFSGHICRCGSYSRIMAAAREVAGIGTALESAAVETRERA
jgi:aerobic-type carbon monoxide dehydrogenase small subunit (CoxS/CutS family)